MLGKKFDYSSRFRILKGGKISLVVSAILSTTIISFAAPSGGVITSGNATISQSGNTTNITQSTNKASINWQKFSINSNETVNFNQPNKNSITLNRVVGNEKSVIDGALNANGQVWILNSNGILFNKNAKINTAGLIATTGELSDKDFQASSYNFKNVNTNSVVNLGTIDVPNSGYVVLASNEVKNQGSIKAVKGEVHLIGSSEYTINLNGNSIVNLIVNKSTLDTMVENSGSIIVNGGDIFLSTNAVNELLKGVVNNTGIIEANSFDGVMGNVQIESNLQINTGKIKANNEVTQKANLIIESGEIKAKEIKQDSLSVNQTKESKLEAQKIKIESDVNNKESNLYLSGNMKGNQIDVTANKVSLVGAKVELQGSNSKLRVGGGWQGQESDIKNSLKTNVINSEIKSSDNSTIVIWSNEETNFDSKIIAPYAKTEISSKNRLNVDLKDIKVKSLLLDPKNIEIKNVAGSVGYAEFLTNSSSSETFKVQAQLENGNIVATASTATIGGLSSVGAVYLYDSNGTLISTLTSSKANDKIGNNGITVLSNGNYVVSSEYWDNGTIGDAGAATLVNGTTGKAFIDNTLLVSASNSLIGSGISDQVGASGVTVLSNGNYVVQSSRWDNGGDDDVGAVTLMNGATGKTYIDDSLVVSTSNSLVGTSYNTFLGGRVTALSNGNYVVSYFRWGTGFDYGKGAVTLMSGTTGKTVIGGNLTVLTSNSLVGLRANDSVGRVTALSNGNYVVSSEYWDNGTTVDAGAVTLMSGTTGKTVIGSSLTISTTNSLVGTTNNDRVGGDKGVVALSNGNYVVASSYWNNGATTSVGAVTLMNGTTGKTFIGDSLTISTANSLVGSTTKDFIGESGVIALSNGNYVVGSGRWNNGAISSVGAVTLMKGSTGKTFIGDSLTVSSTNSLVGSTANDKIGDKGLTVLSNGNYVVASSEWDGSVSNVGAVTLMNGATGKTFIDDSLTISTTNSLIGSRINDSIGYDSVTALSNGNYVVSSSLWWNNAGAVTLMNGATTIVDGKTYTGGKTFIGDSLVVSSVNSLVGTVASDKYGETAKTSVISLNGENALISLGNTGKAYTLGSVLKASFSDNPADNSIIAVSDLLSLLNKGTSVSLQANNDITVTDLITVNNASGNGGNLTLEAGRNINVNNSITTGNGNFTAIAGSTNANLTYKDAGTPTITLASGVSINTGRGKITLFANEGNFVNNAGATPFEASLTSIYLPSYTNATLNGLTVNGKRYNTTYSGGCLTTDCVLPTSGVNLLYSISPKLKVSLEDKIVTYGASKTISLGYTITGGYVNGDNLATSQVSGSVLFSGALSTTGYHVAGEYTNLSYSTGLLSSLGYQFEKDTVATPAKLTINKKSLTVTYIANNKVYNGLTNAVVISADDRVSGDTLTITQDANFIDKNVGTNKTVGVINIVLGGTDALNYNLTNVDAKASTTANITKKDISTITGITADNKTYDANTTATLVTTAATFNGKVSGDTLSVATSTGAFADKNAANNKTVNITGLSLGGDDAANYNLVDNTASTTADISKKDITLSGLSVADKIYDGNTTATLNTTTITLSGVVTGDTVSANTSSVVANFADKNVGINKNITLSGVTLSGADASNYNAIAPASTTANINRLDSVTWVGGTSGNWFDPNNWAGGAVPDLSNVANVIIPVGTMVTFDALTVVAPADASGAVNIDSLGIGGLIFNSGELNVVNTITLDSLTQNGGEITTNDLIINKSFSQPTSSGKIVVLNNATITQEIGDLILGNLEVGGNLIATSTTGNITQTPTSVVIVKDETTLIAQNGDVTLTNPNNDFQGVVNADAINVSLTDKDNINLGNITADGDLNVTSINGNITQTPTSVVIVKDETTLIAQNGDVTLTNPNNDFQGVVNADAINVSLTDKDNINLGNITADGDLNVTSINGNITQTPTSVVIVKDETTLIAQNGDVTLTNPNNDFQGVVNADAINVSLTDKDNINLGNITADGDLNVTSINGNITQTPTSVVIVKDETTLIAQNGDVTLTNPNNDFQGVVNVDSNDVSLTDKNNITLGNITANKDLNVTSITGNITQSPTSVILVKEDTTLTAQNGDVTLTNPNNDFQGVVNADAINVSLTDKDNINLGNITADGDLNVTSINGNITQTPTSVVIVKDETTLIAQNGDVTLTNPNNDFQGVVNADAINVSLTDKDNINLGNITADGDLNVTSINGNITQTPTSVVIVKDETTLIAQNGDVTLTNPNNDFQGVVNADAINVSLTDKDNINLGNITADGDLNVTSINGNITQTPTSVVIVKDETTLIAQNGDVTLTNPNNDFQGVVNADAINVSLTDKDNINLGNITADGDLNVTSINGNITQTPTSVVIVKDETTLIAQNGDVTLTNPNNDFQGVVNVGLNNVKLTDKNDIILGSIIANKGSTIIANNGNITQTKDSIIKVKEDTNLEAKNGKIELSNPTNNFGGKVNVNGTKGVVVLNDGKQIVQENKTDNKIKDIIYSIERDEKEINKIRVTTIRDNFSKNIAINNDLTNDMNISLFPTINSIIVTIEDMDNIKDKKVPVYEDFKLYVIEDGVRLPEGIKQEFYKNDVKK